MHRYFTVLFSLLTLLRTSAVGASTEDNLFKVGSGWEYKMRTTLLLNERSSTGPHVGFRVEATVNVLSVWGGSEGDRLLKIEVLSPQLLTKSQNTIESFTEHSSRLSEFPSTPFLVLWKKGNIKEIYFASDDNLSLVNIKKGIASLLQFKATEGRFEETDASGHCLVNYVKVDEFVYEKIKRECRNEESIPYNTHPLRIFSMEISSIRNINYMLSSDVSRFEKIHSREIHEAELVTKKEAGNEVRVDQELEFVKAFDCESLSLGSLDEAISETITKIGLTMKKDSLLTQIEPENCGNECLDLEEAIKKYKKFLRNKDVGTTQNANVFIKLLKIVRISNREDIAKVLKALNNKDIIFQLIDVVAFAQNIDAHEAAMKAIHFDNEKHLDKSERYLWSVALGSTPDREVMKDLLSRHKKSSSYPKKVQETLLSTLATMAYHYKKSPENAQKQTIYNNIKNAILDGLNVCKDDFCKEMHLRSLINLRDETTIPDLLNQTKGPKKASVLAVRALKALPPSSWNEDVLKRAKQILFQLDKMYDSSARTLSADILIDSKPNDDDLKDLVYYILSKDKAFEVPRYIWEKLKLLAENDHMYREKIEILVKRCPKLNNYAALAVRGMSSILKRNLVSNDYLSMGLQSVQEVNFGLAKRGDADIILESGNETYTLHGLSIFTAGLSKFISDDSTDDDTATAGLEVKIQGMHVRPFVFFTGQGELMGHVWSGTASDRTPAYQATLLLHDHFEYLRLGAGFIAQRSLTGADSFDLSGQISISIWSRNAQAKVENNFGLAVVGVLRVDTSFVTTLVETKLSSEPKLLSEFDTDFSDGSLLCIRVSSADTEYTHNYFKIERIPGSKHKLRYSKYRSKKYSGRTLDLNKKNSEMCRIISESW